MREALEAVAALIISVVIAIALLYACNYREMQECREGQEFNVNTEQCSDIPTERQDNG